MSTPEPGLARRLLARFALIAFALYHVPSPLVATPFRWTYEP